MFIQICFYMHMCGNGNDLRTATLEQLRFWHLAHFFVVLCAEGFLCANWVISYIILLLLWFCWTHYQKQLNFSGFVYFDKHLQGCLIHFQLVNITRKYHNNNWQIIAGIIDTSHGVTRNSLNLPLMCFNLIFNCDFEYFWERYFVLYDGNTRICGESRKPSFE